MPEFIYNYYMNESFPNTPEQKVENCISQEEFDRQFTKDNLLLLEKGEVTYTKVTPEVIKYDEPVLYIGGFSQGKETYRGELQDLVESGREVIFTNPIKGVDVTESDEYNLLKEQYNLPDIILAKVSAAEEILLAEGVEQAELVGHSQGGIITTVLTAKNPERVDNLVLNSPAGFVTGKSRTWLALRFGHQLISNLFRKKDEYLKSNIKRAGQSFGSEAINRDNMESIFATIFWRWKVEVPGISNVDLLPILKSIQDHNDAHPDESTSVSMVMANEDKLYPPEMYQEQLGEDYDDFVNSFMSYRDEEASHTAAGIEAHGLLRQILNKEFTFDREEFEKTFGSE
mgnify:FL=1